MRKDELLTAITFNEQTGVFFRKRRFYYDVERIYELLEGDTTLLDDSSIFWAAIGRMHRDGILVNEMRDRMCRLYGASRVASFITERSARM